VLATAAVAAIAAATWAAGVPTGGETPYSPADAPTQQEPSGPPSPGDVGTPHSDVATSPGSPLSPGLPGSPSSASEHATDPATGHPGRGKGPQGTPPGKAEGHTKELGKGHGKGKAKGHDKSRRDDAVPPVTPVAPDGLSRDDGRRDDGDRGEQDRRGSQDDQDVQDSQGDQRGDRGLIGQ
jgi:hypothetical protein